MSKSGCCDYSDYDYKTEFWTKTNREYEHMTEARVLRELLTTYGVHYRSILDAGCGFGRLLPVYRSMFDRLHLVDYADNMLEQAKTALTDDDDAYTYRQSLYELHINEPVDAIVSIRNLHHLTNTDCLFQNYYQTLTNDGILILDIPNFYHIKRRIRHPFEKRVPMIHHSPSYTTYDPNYIIEKLTESGFNIIGRRNVGLFRIQWIKSVVSPTILTAFEHTINTVLKKKNLSPSVYVVAQKKCG